MTEREAANGLCRWAPAGLPYGNSTSHWSVTETDTGREKSPLKLKSDSGKSDEEAGGLLCKMGWKSELYSQQ